MRPQHPLCVHHLWDGAVTLLIVVIGRAIGRAIVDGLSRKGHEGMDVNEVSWALGNHVGEIGPLHRRPVTWSSVVVVFDIDDYA